MLPVKGGLHSCKAFAHLQGGHGLVEKRVLEHDADLGAHRFVLRAAAQDLHRAPVDADGAQDGFQGGGFACAVFAHKAHNRAGGHVQRYVLQTEILIIFAQPVHLNGIFHGRQSPS